MLILFTAAAAQVAAATPSMPPASAEVPIEAAPAEPAVPTVAKLAALTPIRLKIDKDLVSKTATIGEEFDIVLVNPIDLGNGYAVPAGTRGRGWVIHASKARMGGKAGELLLGARYLKLGNVEIPLRSLKIGPPQGKDNSGLSMGLVATVGVAGMLVTGGQARVDSGMDAIAKTAAEVDLPVALLEKIKLDGAAIVAVPVAPPAPAEAAPATISNTTESKGE